MSRTPHELPIQLELGGREGFYKRVRQLEFIVGEPGGAVEELFGGVGVSVSEAAVVRAGAEPCGGVVASGGAAWWRRTIMRSNPTPRVYCGG